ncbi:hypothetical protein FKM82_005967 [Ascaphus truei]
MTSGCEIVDWKISGDVLRMQWKNLCDSYRRELKKIKVPRSGDAGSTAEEHTSSWPHFQTIEFLKVQMAPVATVSNFGSPSICRGHN